MSNGSDPLIAGDAALPSTANDCGCCEGLAIRTPAAHVNRAGLTSIAYRAGTHGRFKQTMLARLSAAEFAASFRLGTRDNDDFSIALIDAWATVADVLTFYQERLANESYLATATERLSVGELARLIGYGLRPGVAASAVVAFVLEAAPGAPEQAADDVTIRRGVRIQSTPGPNETPQTFETVEDIVSRVAWNALRPRQTVPPVLKWGSEAPVFLSGMTTNLKTGDAVLIVGQERQGTPGDTHWDIRFVETVETQTKADRTRIKFARRTGTTHPHDQQAINNPRLFALRLRAALFGHNAPHPQSLHDSILAHYSITGTPLPDWSFGFFFNFIALDNSYPAVVRDGWLVLRGVGQQALYQAASVIELSLANFTLTGKSTVVELDSTIDLANFAGGNYRITAVYAQSEPLALTETPLREPVAGEQITLTGRVDGIAHGRRVIVRGRRARAVVAVGPITLTSPDDPTATKSLAAGEALTLMTAALELENQPGVKRWHFRTAAGFQGSVETTDDRFTFVPAAADDEVVAEAAIVKTVDADDELHSKLVFTQSLTSAYDRGSAEVLGNVVRVTHGESVSDILGSGDAGAPYQSFALRQSPLTHVSAKTVSGTESTLEIFVNDVRWHEAPALFGHGPTERIYTTLLGDDGRTIVQFGDGTTGARLPTGQNNVVARYRKGIGLAGLVKAGRVNLLTDRPLGVKSAVNPLPTEGAADPEARDDARQNAPVTVLTLDRVVSLTDYEDQARSFGGIAKALASWVWDGARRRIFLTVAGPDGATIVKGGELHTNLLKALQSFGDPFVSIDLASYRPAIFRLKLRIKVDPDRQPDKVLAQVEQALRAKFSFAARTFGQPVSRSEVIATVANLPGVVAVMVDELFRTTPPNNTVASHPRLFAELAKLGSGGDMVAAELLTLDSGPLKGLEVMP